MSSESQMGDMRTAYSDILVKLGHENNSIVVLGADTTNSLKTAAFEKEFPNRFINVGIAEANLVSVGAGLAAAGKTAFVSTYAIFLPGRAVDQIRNAVAYPTRDKKRGLDVKIIVSHGGLSVGADGGSHQQLEDIAIMRAIPNMRVLIPADAITVTNLIQTISKDYGPYYMRMARSKVPDIHNSSQEFSIGGAITVHEGSDCTIAACGITVKMALDAAKLLAADGISARVLDIFSVKPLDVSTIESAARETGCIITCEEHNVYGGMGSAIAESVGETYPVPVHRVGVHDSFGESCRDSEIPALFEKHGITPINIAETVRKARKCMK